MAKKCNSLKEGSKIPKKSISYGKKRWFCTWGSLFIVYTHETLWTIRSLLKDISWKSFTGHSRSSSNRYVLWTSFGRIDKCQPPKKLDLVTSLGLKTCYRWFSIFNRNPLSVQTNILLFWMIYPNRIKDRMIEIFIRQMQKILERGLRLKIEIDL